MGVGERGQRCQLLSDLVFPFKPQLLEAVDLWGEGSQISYMPKKSFQPLAGETAPHPSKKGLGHQEANNQNPVCDIKISWF